MQFQSWLYNEIPATLFQFNNLSFVQNGAFCVTFVSIAVNKPNFFYINFRSYEILHDEPQTYENIYYIL